MNCRNCGEAIEPIQDEYGNEWVHANGDFDCPESGGVIVAEPEEVTA